MEKKHRFVDTRKWILFSDFVAVSLSIQNDFRPHGGRSKQTISIVTINI